MSATLITLACGCAIRLSQPDMAMSEALGYSEVDPLYRHVELIGRDGHIVETLRSGGTGGFLASPESGLGPSPDRKYLSLLVITRGTNVSEELRVIGPDCAAAEFVVAGTGAAIDPARFIGWAKTQPHAIRVTVTAREQALALPIGEVTLPQ